MSESSTGEPVEVDIPQTERIELFHLLVLITRAKHFDLEDTKGAQSIVAKDVYSIHRPEGDRLALTEKDRRLLSKLESDLPKISPRASNEEKLDFAQKYWGHPERAKWAPVIASDGEAYEDRMEILGERVDERNSLIEAIKTRLISVFDANGIQQYTYYPKFYLSWPDAIIFLRAQGMFQLHPTKEKFKSRLLKKVYEQEVLDFAEKSGNQALAARKYGVHRETLTRWAEAKAKADNRIALVASRTIRSGVTASGKILRVTAQSPEAMEGRAPATWLSGLSADATPDPDGSAE